jgi:hypothetical protein
MTYDLASGLTEQPALHKQLRDLHRIRGSTFAQVVPDDPQVEAALV